MTTVYIALIGYAYVTHNKNACSVTILVAAVPLTVPGIVFAVMAGNHNPDDYTRVTFDLTLDNKSNTQVQYYICTQSGKLINSGYTDYGTYPEFSPPTNYKYNYKKIPAGQKYDTGIDASLLKIDASGQCKVYIGPALPTQKGAFYINSACKDSPAFLKVILPSVSTPQIITMTGTSNGLDSMSISSPALIPNDPVQPYPSKGVVPGRAILDSFVLSSSSGNICINDQIKPYNFIMQNNTLAVQNGTYTIKFPSINSDPCSYLNTSTTFNLLNNTIFTARAANTTTSMGNYNTYSAKEKMFLARTSLTSNAGMASVIAMTGGYPAYNFCIDGIVRNESGPSGSGTIRVTPGTHIVSKVINNNSNMTSVCDDSTQSKTK